MPSYGIVVRFAQGSFLEELFEVFNQKGKEALLEELKEYDTLNNNDLCLADYPFRKDWGDTSFKRISEWFKHGEQNSVFAQIIRIDDYVIYYSTYYYNITLYKKVEEELSKIEN